jgi:Xaa-Pro aminopeptidase
VTKTGTAGRRARLHLLMNRLGLDAAIVSETKNVCYFTGFLEQAPAPVPSYLISLRDGTDLLLTGEKRAEQAGESFRDQIVTFRNYDLRSRMVARPDFASAMIVPLLAKVNMRKVGIEAWHAPKALLDSIHKAAPQVAFIDLSRPIESMRMVKDPDEVACIRASCGLVDYAYSVAESVAVPGVSEVELYAAVHRKVVEKAGGFQYFSGDFTTGRRSIDPGRTGAPTSLILKKGDTLILDLWTQTNGYWADTCRTFMIGAQPTREQVRVYRVVERAMKAGVAKMRPGTTGGDVYRAVKSVMVDAGYGRLFTHHAGHGLGLEPWERPYLIPSSKDVIEEGMVLALEPGVYLKGVAGVRLENNYLVEKDGAVSLSRYPMGW